jgi:hypothetical protein
MYKKFAYKQIKGNSPLSIRKIRTHNSLEDAKGNAEAFLEIVKRYNLKI